MSDIIFKKQGKAIPIRIIENGAFNLTSPYQIRNDGLRLLFFVKRTEQMIHD